MSTIPVVSTAMCGWTVIAQRSGGHGTSPLTPSLRASRGTCRLTTPTIIVSGVIIPNCMRIPVKMKRWYVQSEDNGSTPIIREVTYP